MAVSTDELNIQITVDSDGAVKGIKNLDKSLTDLDKDAKRLDKTTVSTGKSLSKMGQASKDLSVAVIAANQAMEIAQKVMMGLDRVARFTLGNFAALQTAMVGVAKTTNLTDKELESLQRSFQNLSEEIPAGAVALAGYAEIAGQLGVSGSANLEKFAETIARLSVATVLDGNEAAQALTRILNVTNESIGTIDQFASVLVRLGNNFAANEQQIVRMTTEVARASTVFNVTSGQAAAIGTTLASLGVRAELAGSTISRVFNKINTAIKGGGTELETLSKFLGKSADVIEKDFGENAVTTFQDFLISINKVRTGGGDVSKALAEFGLVGEEVLKVLPVLSSRTDILAEALGHVTDEIKDTNALVEESDKAFGTLASQFDIMKNKTSNLGVSLGVILEPVAKLLISIGNGILFIGTKLAELFVVAASFGGIFLTVLLSGVETLGKWVVGIQDAVGFAEDLGAAVKETSGLIKNFFGFGDLPKTVEETRGAAEQLNSELSVTTANFEEMAIEAEKTGAQIRDMVSALALESLTTGGSAADRIDAETVARVNQQREIIKSVKLKQEERKIDALNAAVQIAAAEDMIRTIRKIQSTKFALLQIEETEKLLSTTQNMGVALAGIDVTRAEAADLQFADTMRQIDAEEARLFKMGLITQEMLDQLNIHRELAGETAKQKKAQIAGGKKIFDRKQLESIENAGGAALGGIASGISDMFSGPMAAVSAMSQVVSAAQGIVDAIPNLLNSMTGLVQSIVDFPQVFKEALLGLANVIPKLVSEFIPNILRALPDIVEGLISALVVGLPDAFLALGEMLPDIVMDIISRLPEIVSTLIAGLIVALPKIAVGLVKAFIALVPFLIVELIKAIPLIIEAIIVGIVEGFSQIGDLFADSVGKGISDGFKDAQAEFSGLTSSLFSVQDFGAAAKVDDLRNTITELTEMAEKIGKTIWEGFKKAVSDAWEWIKKMGLQIWNGFVENAERIGQFFVDMGVKIWHGILQVASEIWTFFEDLGVKIIDGFITVMHELETFFTDMGGKIWSGLSDFAGDMAEFFGGMGSAIWHGILDLADQIATELGSWGFLIWRGIVDAVRAAFDFLAEMGSKIWGGFTDAIGNVTEFFKQMGRDIWEGFKELFNIPGLSGGGGDDGGFFDQTREKLGFAMGGPVKHLASGGFGSVGTDTVPAMLSPGEFVLKRSAAESIGLDTLNQANRTGSLGGGSQNFDIKINITGNKIDEDFMRGELMDQIKDSLRAASRNGELIVSERGVF